MVYFIDMNTTMDLKINLAELRENAGLTARELARQLNIHHSTVLQWEQNGKVAKTEYLLPVSQILGVSVEELLGQPKSRKNNAPGGRLGQVFSEVSTLPRRQQQKVIEMAEGFLSLHGSRSKG
jgi:transcriptional regulator with XRE-family HTH domain